MAKLNWYAIQLTNDALTVSQRKIGYWGPKMGRYIVPIQRGKLLVEKSMQDLGIEIYIPWERKRIVHSRSKKQVDRDFPLIPGYAFVQCSLIDCNKVVKAEGVSNIMTFQLNNKTRIPEAINPLHIHQIRMAEHAIFLDHIAKHAPLTRRKLSKKFRPGDKLNPKPNIGLGKVGVVNVTTGRKTVKTTIEMFGTMVKAEISVNLVDVA